MPLEKAPVGSPGFSRNVETEVKAGKPVAQAVAIAYKMAGEKRGDAANAAIYEENGEFYFPKPGSHERYGPYASKAEARTAAVNAGVVADDAKADAKPNRADEMKKAENAVRHYKDKLEKAKKELASGSEYAKDWGRADVIAATKKLAEAEKALAELKARKDADEAILGRADDEPKVGATAKTVYGEGKIVKINNGSVIVHVAGEDRKLSLKQYSIMNDAAKADADRLPAHIKHHGIHIDTSFKKGSNGTDADYWVVQGSSGRFYSLAAAKEVAEGIAKRKAAKADAAPTIVREGNQWIISVDEGGSVSIFRLDVSEYPTEADALEYALSNPQYTNRKDSLPALDRALAAADALYAKADAAGDKTYVVKYVNSVDKTGIIEVKAGSRDEAQTKAKKELGGECKRIFYVSEIASRSDAERDLPGSSTTEGNYGIDAKASK